MAAASEVEALRRLSGAGKIRLPAGTVPSPGQGPVAGVPPGLDIAAILDDVRSGP